MTHYQKECTLVILLVNTHVILFYNNKFVLMYNAPETPKQCRSLAQLYKQYKSKHDGCVPIYLLCIFILINLPMIWTEHASINICH